MPSKTTAGSKKPKSTANNKNGLLNIYEKSDLLDKHLAKDETDFNNDDRIEAINN